MPSADKNNKCDYIHEMNQNSSQDAMAIKIIQWVLLLRSRTRNIFYILNIAKTNKQKGSECWGNYAYV